MRLKADWFVAGLVGAAALAWVAPDPGARGGLLHPETTSRLGVALVFLIHGAGISFGSLRAGSLRWPVHGVVQAVTYLVFPLAGLAAWFLLDGVLGEPLRLGLLFLCAAPSTVSSSVAMTAIARGSVAEALFNATISSLIGIVLTPLWVTAVASTSGQSIDAGAVIWSLVRLLVLPLAAGQGLRLIIGDWVGRHRQALGLVDRLVILFLVYTAFCESFQAGAWGSVGTGQLIVVLAVCLGFLALALVFVDRFARLAGFTRGERVASLFCGSQKSIASGLPMANLLFATNPALGVIILPLMLYHALQLILSAPLAAKLGREPGVA